MSAHGEEPLTVDKEYVADLAVTASAKGKELVWAPGTFRYVMMVCGTSPPHLSQAAHLTMRVALATAGPDDRGRPGRPRGVGGGPTAISTVEWPAFPSSNQLHALTTVGPGRLPARTGGRRVAVAAWAAQPGGPAQWIARPAPWGS